MIYLKSLCVMIFVDSFLSYVFGDALRGRYTETVFNYQLVIPRKLHEDGTFRTFQIPHYFDHKDPNIRKKRSIPHITYGITFNNNHHYLHLWPSYEFASPGLVFEKRSQPKKMAASEDLRNFEANSCHYYGVIKNRPNSRVALSTCNGLTGSILVDAKRYFIEPMAEFTPNELGQHLHLVHDGGLEKRNAPVFGNRCGTNVSWEMAWKMRFKREFQNQRNYKKTDDKRNVANIERYLETLVVADKKFLEHHKNTDHDTYILTIMNMVADFYHDSTVGQLLNVVVVRVVYLEKEEEEIDLMINANADDTLASFCKWQKLINPKDIQHPNHHDIAILLTRYDICADSMTNCGLMGLAYVAAACTSDEPCAINEDSGLVLGVVVAHEMGHVMGCSHDNLDESGCKPQAEDKSYYVMSPYVHINTNVWSTCSKTFVTEFFDNNLGECLNDEPQESIYKDTGVLPGAMYDANYQCNIVFPGSTVCATDPDKFCERLLCKTSPNKCMSNGEPPADGTKCGENMWCYDSKCVEIGERPLAVNGGWGAWGPATKCSRSCGGGVSYSERECNNPVPKHKGRYCMGDRKKVTLCNTQECPSGTKSYREQQCSEFDSKPFNDKLYKWEPYFKEDEPCVLYCINTDRIFTKLSPRAKDGTKCKRGTRNVCISGACRKVGCDYVIDSDAIEDDCGICKGDGTQCKLVDQMYSDSAGYGYVKVTVIPKGSRNVFVEEQLPSDNTIAISAKDEKKFYLNGDFTEKQDGDYDIGGAEGVYSHPEPNKEEFVIHGPLKEDIVLFIVYYNSENVGYHYKYAEPIAQSTYQPRYHWEFVEWEDCSVRCGGGTEVSQPECMEEKHGKVSSSFCSATDKPEIKVRKCNDQPCKTRWRVGKWSNCTACKYQTGVRTREVECVREAQEPGKEDVLVDDDKCPGEKPGTREICNAHKTCPKSKRSVFGLSPEELKYVWFQTMEDYMQQEPVSLVDVTSNSLGVRRARRNIINLKRKRDCGKQNSHASLKVGTIVDDKIPPEEIKLIEVPVKQSHLSLNLTDASFETMGDKIADSIDTCNEKVYTGKEAAEILKEAQHENQTAQSI